jgi:hydrogenase maturation factor
VRRPGLDAAVLRIDGTRGLAVTLDGPPLGCRNPMEAGWKAVLEAAMNVACAGGEPLALTDCLNFGNPEKPEIGWELAQAIEGISRAAESLGIPVVSGNVSLYNETGGSAIPPTPVIGCVGLVRDVTKIPNRWRSGDRIVLLRGFGHGLVHFVWRHAALFSLAHDVSDGGVARRRPGPASLRMWTSSRAKVSSSRSIPQPRFRGTTWSSSGWSPDVRRVRGSCAGT